MTDDAAKSSVKRIMHDLRNALGASIGHVQAIRPDDRADTERRVERVRVRIEEGVTLIGELERELQSMTVAPGHEDTLLSPGTEAPEVPEERPTLRPGAVEPEGLEVIGGIYRPISLIGRGGMGTVLLAHDERLRRDVALKLLEHEVWDNEHARLAFAQEARAMAQVNHPNVVTIFALGEHKGKPFLAMEYVRGTTLEALMIGPPLQMDQALAVVEQICRGVTAIHDAGAVHRDIKPSNVLIGPALRVAVADLGLAHHLGDDEPLLHGGTPGYMAPEVLAGSTLPDVATDVYAIGVIMRELLTGRRAFEGDTTRDVVTAQLTGDVTAIAEPRGAIPAVLVPIVDRAMALNPAKRYRSVEALRVALFEARATVENRYDTKVFVVDDDEDVRESLTHLSRLGLPGAEVMSFDRGAAALDAAEREAPQIAIVDLAMPDLNGFELATLLKQGATPVEHVIVVTGVGGAADWDLLRHVGASGFLVKPVEPTALAALLRNLVGPQAETSAAD